jgi:hypothetical protein
MSNNRYNIMERGRKSQYPNYKDAAPNLQSYLNAINRSQPII